MGHTKGHSNDEEGLANFVFFLLVIYIQTNKKLALYSCGMNNWNIYNSVTGRLNLLLS